MSSKFSSMTPCWRCGAPAYLPACGPVRCSSGDCPNADVEALEAERARHRIETEYDYYTERWDGKEETTKW
jgi:hypothetical protein